MAQVTFLDLKNGARERADMVNSSFISTQEEDRWINLAWKKLYDILTNTFQNYSITSTTINVNSSTTIYPLPTDFYKVRRVDELQTNDRTYPIRRVDFPNNNVFQAKPVRSMQVLLWYVPDPVTLVLDTDEVSINSGWEEYIMLDAAIKYLTKEESDVRSLVLEREKIETKIKENATIRDIYRPKKIIDVYARRLIDDIIYSDSRYDIVGNNIHFYSSEFEVAYSYY